MIENSSQRDTFIHYLDQVNQLISSNGVEYIVVGGIALRASMNKEVQFVRNNGTTPDVDLLALGPNPETIKRTKDEVKKYRKNNPDCPAIGLESVTFSDNNRHNFPPLGFLSGDRKDSNGDYFLTFRSIDQPVDSRVMTIFIRNYGGVNIPTLPQETIYHRYFTRMGAYLKPKDIQKVNEFKDYIERNGGDSIDPSLYYPYTEFSREVAQRYPKTISISKKYWDIDYHLNGKFSGSSGIIYRITELFHR